MALLEEIQKDLLAPDVNLSDILRKTKVLAYEISNDALKNWIDAELNGYTESQLAIPSYRVFYVNSVGEFFGAHGEILRNFPVHTNNLPEDFRAFIDKFEEKCGIKSLEDLITTHKHDKSSEFLIPWPSNLIARHRNKILNKYQLMQAWQCIGRNQIVGVIDTVRNRLVDFVLELKEEFPEIRDNDNYSRYIGHDKAAHIVQTIVMGDNNIVASGRNINQQVKLSVRPNDWESLKRFLMSIGVLENETASLKSAIEQDGVPKNNRILGSCVAKWILDRTKDALQGVAINIRSGIFSGLIVQAICIYYNWT